ncbi:MAG: trimeric intracellular cation channel family protein [Ilumatobacteraceae bacterium]
MPANDDVAFALLEAVGTFAFAVSGGAVAVRAGMDWLGVMVLAVVTAVGGGTLRDLLLGTHPVWWIDREWPLALAAVGGLAVIGVAHRIPHVALDSQRSALVGDAIGLGAFTVTGVLLGLEAGVASWTAVVLGVVTGAGGGVLRDVLAQRRPLILVAQIYAVAAFAGAAVVAVLAHLEAPAQLTRWLGVVVIVVVRVLAIRRQWHLPRFAATDDTTD